jgi:hypothetical protein
MLIGLFGLPGFCFSTVFRAVSFDASDYVDFGAFLVNGAFVVGSIIIWVVWSQRIRHPSDSPRPSGYES